MLSERSRARAEGSVVRLGDPLSPKLAVHSSPEATRRDNSLRLWVNADEAKIEKDVNIGSQQEAVGRVVSFSPAVRRDVGGLKDLDDFTARQRTPSAVRVQKYLPEGTLPATSNDRRDHTLPSVCEVVRIEDARGVVLGFPTVNEYIQLRCGARTSANPDG